MFYKRSLDGITHSFTIMTSSLCALDCRLSVSLCEWCFMMLNILNRGKERKWNNGEDKYYSFVTSICLHLLLLDGQRWRRERGCYESVSTDHPQPETLRHRDLRSDESSREIVVLSRGYMFACVWQTAVNTCTMIRQRIRRCKSKLWVNMYGII